MGRRFGGQPGDCPVTERVSDQLVRLPFHNAITNQDLSKVVRAIQEFDF
jgi:dTDP-4-amino-4,6-dideoxygalactose transaminase